MKFVSPLRHALPFINMRLDFINNSARLWRFLGNRFNLTQRFFRPFQTSLANIRVVRVFTASWVKAYRLRHYFNNFKLGIKLRAKFIGQEFPAGFWIEATIVKIDAFRFLREALQKF